MTEATQPASATLATFDQDDPRARGEAHGELWRAEIRELLALRIDLARRRGAAEDPRAGAGLHLEPLLRFAPALHAELLGIAAGAAIADAEAMLLNAPPPGEPAGSTAIYVPGEGAGAVLGQTLDLPAALAPFLRVMRICPRGGDDELLCVTLTGCLGLAGLSGRGVGVAVCELASTERQAGVPAPAALRALLAADSAAAARDLLLAAPLATGHNYMIADADAFFGVETSGPQKFVTQVGARAAHLHTNHCFDPVLRKRERVPPGSTSFRRLELASTLYVQQRPQGLAGLWALLASHDGHPRGLCSHVGAADDPAVAHTVGRVAMQLATGELWAGGDCSGGAQPHTFRVIRWRSR